MKTRTRIGMLVAVCASAWTNATAQTVVEVNSGTLTEEDLLAGKFMGQSFELGSDTTFEINSGGAIGPVGLSGEQFEFSFSRININSGGHFLGENEISNAFVTVFEGGLIGPQDPGEPEPEYEHDGGDLNIFGGTVNNRLDLNEITDLTMTAGRIEGQVNANDTVDMEISGGSIGESVFVDDGADVVVSGGQFEDVFLIQGFTSDGTVSGGVFGGDFRASDGELHLVVQELSIDGSPVSLSPDEPTPIDQRGGASLQATLADGSPFAVTLSDDIGDFAYITPGCELTASLAPPPQDTDGDGLLDEWETEGVPFTGTGGEQRRYMLPGADPMRKNLYVEIDAMSGVEVAGGAIGQVISAFSDAPLSNPDGSEGVSLTVLLNETDLPLQSPWMTDGCWPLDFDDFREDHYGTQDERNDPDAEALLEAKAKAVRYCIAADVSGPESIGGCGERPGDNFVVYIGSTRNETDQAAVLMHELGHNLGLRHGGGDGINGKPNYPSIMNYALLYKFNWNQNFWRLDYSREGTDVFGSLDESDLDETEGVGAASSFYSGFLMPFGVTRTAPGGTERAFELVSLDGARVDFGNAQGDFMQDGQFTAGVSQDLNWLPSPPPGIILPASQSPGQVLEPFNDWAHVELQLAAANDNAPAPAFPQDELTTEARDWIEQNFPAPCPADLTGPNGVPDGMVTSADFLAYIDLFAAGDPRADLTGGPNGEPDGMVTSADFLAYIDAFAQGCP